MRKIWAFLWSQKLQKFEKSWKDITEPPLKREKKKNKFDSLSLSQKIYIYTKKTIGWGSILTKGYSRRLLQGGNSSEVARNQLDSCKDFCENLWIFCLMSYSRY